jgi:sterol desaturase/sphingolipid hydroxylase (fatty acid hydroxylase superfamily)
MKFSKAGYYADFAVYVILLGVLIRFAMFEHQWPQHLKWLAAAAAGAAVWTLIEYALHRFGFHHMPVLSTLHGMHHESPRALLGTPSWLSIAVLGGTVFLPVLYLSSLNVASGMTAGVIIGYLWYGVLHHVVHHRRPRFLARRVTQASHRHFRHHANAVGNFGVTTALWDHIFGTVLHPAPHRRGHGGPSLKAGSSA